MGRLRQKCGAVTGGFMVLGLAFGNTDPKDMETKFWPHTKKVLELNQMVEDIYGTSNCVELLKKHATEAEVVERKHHKIICRRLVKDVAGLLFDIIPTPNSLPFDVTPKCGDEYRKHPRAKGLAKTKKNSKKLESPIAVK